MQKEFKFSLFLQALCELDSVLVAKQMLQDSRFLAFPQVPQVFRNLRYDSDIDMRNFRIIKDYVRALQYFSIGFQYFYSRFNIQSTI